ncbi:response regulator transcription factor [Nocardioides mangrovi]|uniref:Response regulator transcription factor n=1 Tax=Nocardioides mangrovi TaxID=2874580 RepID=A0ABS7UAV3_9ACTN|nr:response regulator transcription factor [Nocardioides mangrovi]MBZ5738130.1 response regulator transcription factor [Nocardioides mangrovi]
MSRVLVVDDEHQIGHAIRSALEREGDEVLVAHTGHEGLELLATTQPDLLVLDLHLPDLHGTEIVRRVRPWFTHPVLVLSAVSDERSRVEALDAGADDFLTKPFGLAELRARLRAIRRRTTAEGVGPTSFTYGDLVVDLAARTLTVAGSEVLLTPTEWRLLVAFTSNPQVLLTHRQLLTEGWSQGYGDESRQALRAHIRSLRSKIGDPATAPVYIRTESGAGYRWVADPGASVPAAAAPPGPDATAGGAPGGSSARLHDLSNVLTTMRLAIDLADGGLDTPSDAGVFLEQMTDLVDRATVLVAEIDRGDGVR